MSQSGNYANTVSKYNNEILNINTAKVMNANIKQTQVFSQATSSAKMLNYKNIAPAPPLTGFKSIAPANTISNLNLNTTNVAVGDVVGVKARKYTPRATIPTSIAPYSVDQTQSVQRRNARERNRVKQVNNSFARLRQHLPQYIVADLTKGGGRGPHKKISKVDTLRIAVEYIRRLEYLVEDLGGNDCVSTENDNDISATAAASATTSNVQASMYYTTSTNPQEIEFQQQQLPKSQCYSSTLLTPVSLAAFSPVQTKVEISCHSPTASYISNTSFDSGTYEPAQQLSPEHYSEASSGELAPTTHANLALKYEPYEHFRLDEEDCTPDDDEIIDYISLWQEEQQASQN